MDLLFIENLLLIFFKLAIIDIYDILVVDIMV